MSNKKFYCIEYINYPNQCKKQCNSCRDIDNRRAKKWIELEDGNGDNEVN